MRTLLRLVFLALLPTLGGCAVWKSLFTSPGDAAQPESATADPGPGETAAAATSPPPECVRPGPPPASELERRRGYVLLVACGENLDPTAARAFASTMPDVFTWQAGLDDRVFDQVRVGLALTTCLGEFCPLSQGWRVSEGRLSAYVTHYDAETLHKDLRKLRVTQTVARTFVAKVDARVDALAKRTWDDKPAYVDVPLRIVLERQEYLHEHAARFASLEDVMNSMDDGGKAGDVVPRLEELRAQYLAACEHETCWADRFPMEVTRRLVEVHSARDHRAAAYAERNALLRARPDSAKPARFWLAWRILTLPGHVTAAQDADAFISHTLLAYGVPERPESLDLEERWGKNSVNKVVNEVATVGAPKGGWSTVRFKDKVDAWEQEYGCRRTNRVERIYADGEVEYEERCKYRVREDRTKYDVIKLPAREAKSLQPGDALTAFQVAGESKAILASARRDGREVVWRTHSLTPR